MKKIIKSANKLQNTKLFELNEAYQKVLFWFFSFPDLQTSLNDLSSALKISKNTAKIIVNDLEKTGFLIKKIYGKSWLISCNKNHYLNFSKKVVFNLGMIFEAFYSGHIRDEILKIVGNAQSIVLFGSYRKGDDNEKSDIDLAVETVDNSDLRIVNLGVLPKFGFRNNVPVNLHIFCRKKLDINLFSNIANGIVLEGFLEVRI
jgi:predicted nucleotidyltransferase